MSPPYGPNPQPSYAHAPYGAPRDPFFASVVLLLHFNGANGSQVFTDQKGHAFAVGAGAPVLSTAAPRFGTAAMFMDKFDGSLIDYISTPHNADLEIAAADWTVEYFIRFMEAVDRYGGYVTKGNGAAIYSWFCDIDAGRLQVNVNGVGDMLTAAQVFVTNQWYHIAFCRAAGVTRGFVDGIQVGAGGATNSPGNAAVGVLIGNADNSGASAVSTHMMDELRVTKGVARYTANFTPPSAPFPNG